MAIVFLISKGMLSWISKLDWYLNKLPLVAEQSH